MTRKPKTTPEVRHPGSSPRLESPTFRPVGPVPSDRDTDWIPLIEAIDMLSPVLGRPRAAADWILRHVFSGEVAITCRLLTYRKHGGGMETSERHEWPGREARLAEQIEKGVFHPLAGFDAHPGTGDFEWLDETGPYPVDARMSFPHVDRAALVSYFPKLQEPAPAEQAAPIVAMPADDGLRGRLPLNAKPADRRDEPFAHAAARHVREGMKLAAAIREVAPAVTMMENTSAHSGVRRAYNLMYDHRGMPIRN